MTDQKPRINEGDLPKLEKALELAKKNKRWIHYCLSSEDGASFVAPLNADDLLERLVAIDGERATV